MSYKREEGDNYTPAQEDFVAGRLPSQSKAALKAKTVRGFIAKNPGCTSYDIRVKLGVEYVGSLDWLTSRNLIRFENSPTRQYFVVPL
jgi:hypothetical protein